MPNIASVLKEEIARLVRKELKKELEGIKKGSARTRSEIAALKRSVAALEKQVTRLNRNSNRRTDQTTEPEESSTARFSAKGLASHRKRLGLSAAELGVLLDVSAQTIYNWESGKTRPGPAQVAAIAATRKMGKRQARALLADMEG